MPTKKNPSSTRSTNSSCLKRTLSREKTTYARPSPRKKTTIKKRCKRSRSRRTANSLPLRRILPPSTWRLPTWECLRMILTLKSPNTQIWSKRDGTSLTTMANSCSIGTFVSFGRHFIRACTSRFSSSLSTSTSLNQVDWARESACGRSASTSWLWPKSFSSEIWFSAFLPRTSTIASVSSSGLQRRLLCTTSKASFCWIAWLRFRGPRSSSTSLGCQRQEATSNSTASSSISSFLKCKKLSTSWRS